mmetsp:Transcript_1917/g.5296  ORF Transcript_1917/g.5296 Transcript_1917/m.5296 type:complete len:216 (-) Transcript_1917:1046-1693(-)
MSDGTEVKLYNNLKERAAYDNLADLYALLVATEHLEKAYVRDSCTADEYTPECKKLIAQFRTLMSHGILGDDFVLDEFLKEYDLHCPSAVHRLVEKGIPATIEHDVSSTTMDASASNQVLMVAQATQGFITAMDALKLNMVAVDEVQPQLHDLLETLGKIKELPADFEGKEKLKSWLAIINRMKAADELDEDQARQLTFDLESSYNAFHRWLGNQ